MTLDYLGRPTIADGIKAQIAEAFKAVPDGKRTAVLVIADENGTRAHFAAKVGEHWKVAGSGGWTWTEAKPIGYVAVEGSW